MAQWVSRPRADGGTSVQIKWRMDGRWQCETFTDARRAAEFRTAVELAGHRWPTGWLKGQGWQPTPTPPPAPPRMTFAQVAHGPKGYFERQAKRARLDHLKPRTLHALRRTYTLHLEETFAALDFTAVDISEWIDTLIDAGAAAKTIHEHHGLLSSIIPFESAVRGSLERSRGGRVHVSRHAGNDRYDRVTPLSGTQLSAPGQQPTTVEYLPGGSCQDLSRPPDQPSGIHAAAGEWGD